MSESPHVFLSQMQLVCAIMSELDRQNPGVLVNLDTMNVIIRAADDIIDIARTGLTFLNNSDKND